MYTKIVMIRISATEARNKFFEILNLTMYKGEEFLIEKRGKPVAKIVPIVAKRKYLLKK